MDDSVKMPGKETTHTEDMKNKPAKLSTPRIKNTEFEKVTIQGKIYYDDGTHVIQEGITQLIRNDGKGDVDEKPFTDGSFIYTNKLKGMYTLNVLVGGNSVGNAEFEADKNSIQDVITIEKQKRRKFI